ncbi:MAG: type I DNA topoisomerase [Bacteroidales bacterium]|nr:type I DNA topoisomerase [Bacteroidales bacterium]MDY2917164.1 type I DNA topoisomerase [Muribaculaceae bacterium]
MQKNLVIVESPAKAKTIEKFLGSDYKVMSSYGHIRDLCKKNFSVEVDNGYKPIYEIPEDKKGIVADLKKAAKKAETVWLASDEDREGEAIAWHLYEVLGLKPENTRRIVFHEITKNAILHAIENPRDIDLNLVDAQQARRVLDRIVGFELSPVLWKKIKPQLSAGRVQSVAVRLIVDREEEIKNFKAEPYMRVTGRFDTDAGHAVRAELSRRLPDMDAAQKFLEDCRGAAFTVGDVQVKPLRKSPAPPFTTSTLQQEASRKLGFTVSQTMMVAQRLYEAGHITYMRTDSLNLSSLAIDAISKEIENNIGAPYLKVRHYHTSSKGAQEAHEAIRPTYIEQHAIEGTPQEKKLYNLIWKRTIASQMADAEIEKTTVDIGISTRPEHFTASGEVIKFDGFLKIYIEGHDDENVNESETSDMLPKMSAGESLAAREITAHERFTQQPARYTEASLVKKLEELGIGRPSTYAPTISTIQQREYVEKGEREGEERTVSTLTLTGEEITRSSRRETFGAEKGKLIPTDIGIIVNRFLTEYFPRILDYNFTARVEGKFDEIAEGELRWQDEIGGFYTGFHPDVEKALNMRLEHKVGERLLGNDPATGQPVTVKIGRFGPLVQVGGNDGDEKPRFASLQKGQSVETITLEEALKLFKTSRSLGEYEGEAVSVGSGRFGPYIKHSGKFISIPKDMDATAVTLDDAIALIEAKRTEERNKIVKEFAEDADVRILNGRYGVYISAGGSNYKIPKTVAEPSALTLEQCREIIAAQDSKPRRTTRRAASAARKTK